MNSIIDLAAETSAKGTHTSAPRVIYNSAERYCTAQPNQICFISDRQTMHLTMGSCISTVFIGKNGRYVLAANHIIIAKAREGSPAAKKGAQEQILEIIHRFESDFGITKENIRCVHIIGGGTRHSDTSFKIHEENARETDLVLSSLGFRSILIDTNSFISAIFSVSRNNLSVFIEDTISKHHITYTLNIDLLFSHCSQNQLVPASALAPNNIEFEKLVANGAIYGISGSRLRV